MLGSTARPTTPTDDGNWESLVHVEPASTLFQIWLPEAAYRVPGFAGTAAAAVIEGRLAGNSLDALPVARLMRAREEPPGAACVAATVGKSSEVVAPTI